MKRITRIISSCLVVAAFSTAALAEFKTIGDGANMQVDITNYPPNMKAIYPMFIKKCIKCHGLDRTFITIQTGMTPSGAVFDNAAIEAYGAKMLRKPDSDMNKSETKQAVELMKYMLQEATKELTL